MKKWFFKKIRLSHSVRDANISFNLMINSLLWDIWRQVNRSTGHWFCQINNHMFLFFKSGCKIFLEMHVIAQQISKRTCSLIMRSILTIKSVFRWPVYFNFHSLIGKMIKIILFCFILIQITLANTNLNITFDGKTINYDTGTVSLRWNYHILKLYTNS